VRAAWYSANGPAAEVLTVGEMDDPVAGRGEVRVRVASAGLNPRDVKRRSGSGGRTLTVPRLVPGDDASGVIDQVGPGVPIERIGERVWIHSANVDSPFGTSAELVLSRTDRAIPLPESVSFDIGASLGVPALTAHRALFADGPIDGLRVIVTGGAGAVAQYAIRMASLAGARVLATGSTDSKRQLALDAGAELVVDHRRPDARQQILGWAPEGADRIVDVAFGANLPLNSAVIAPHGVIASYGSDQIPNPIVPFYELMRLDVSLRFVSVFLMPRTALSAAARDITVHLENGALRPTIAARFGLDDVVAAHELFESGVTTGKILLAVSE
jgi:NADPH:quinone reductase